MSQNISTTHTDFYHLGLPQALLTALHNLNIVIPTPIQRQAIPIAMEGKDVVGVAQTGTGKTLAFALPLLFQISKNKKTGLIVLPTRELAMQVNETFLKIGKGFGLRTALLIGGAPMGRQYGEIQRRPHVIIGTPGRINDHIQQGTLKLHNVGVLVLDEADHMFDMGFLPQITAIIKNIPHNRQTMLFSATMPPAIMKLAATHMKLPVRVEIALPGTIADRIQQELFIVSKDQKNRLLDKILDENSGTTLIFSRTKHGARKICRSIRGMGHTAAEIHSNLSMPQRRRSLDGFKSGEHRVLVATDIAARGIDVSNIELVVNYDLPDNPDDYVHRIGRTGRNGKSGLAITFVTPDQRGKIRIIEKLVRESLKISPLPQLPPARPMPVQHHQVENQNFGHRNSRTGFKKNFGNRRNHHKKEKNNFKNGY